LPKTGRRDFEIHGGGTAVGIDRRFRASQKAGAMTVWANLSAFLLLVPLLFMLGWAWWRDRRKRPSVQFSSLGFKKTVGPGLRARLSWLPLVLYAVALGFMITALARPQKADTRVKKNIEGIDIMMVLDVSDSMAIEDMTPNRMEASKKMIKQFIQKRASDRIGYIIFSGESYTRVPLTLDYNILLQSVSETKISRNIKMGTAIGVALANAVARLKDSTAKSRVIVFLTDGENNSGTIDPETALEVAKGYGIRIYTIGAGVDGDAQLPVESTDAFGRKVKRYQPIHSTVNDDLLGKMASETGGKYYRATNTEALGKVFNDIDRLEKTKIDVNQYTKYDELYQKWAMLGVWLSIAALALGQTVLRRVP
jgi:Ca-activated chloride channel family protein